MPSFCAVSCCELKYSHSENVSFHKFPLKNPKILAEWIKFTNRGATWKPSRWNSICSRHFDRSDFREYLSRKCLKKEAIPTIVTKNTISYETYHISSGSPEYSCTDFNPLEQNDYETQIETIDDNKASTDMVETCRLCGEPADNLTCNPLKSFDDPEVDLMCRKCLPSVNMHIGNTNHLRTVCSDCIAQLKQYSQFTDKILLYQRELCVSENFDSYATSENSLNNGSQSQCGIKSLTPNPNVALFIKQEPVNVKQENVESTNRRPFTTQIPTTSPSVCLNPFADTKKIKGSVQHDISLPKTEAASTYCEQCDQIFANSLEFQSHMSICSCMEQNTDREHGNNGEIMEVITFNDPVSFIDLAEDENATNIEPRKPKPEGLCEFELRERLEFEHAYARRATNASCNLKQEIIDSYNDTSQSGFDYNDQNNEHIGQSTYFNAPFRIHIYCQKCDQSFVSQELLDEHLTDSHPLKHKICSICNAEFKTSYEYLIHKTKMHTQRFQCKQCKQKFYRQTILRLHERLCTRDFYLSCRHCGKSIRNLVIMRKHLGICMGRQTRKQLQPLRGTQKNERFYLQPKKDHDEIHSSQNARVPMPETETNPSEQQMLTVDDVDSEVKQSFKFIVDDSKFIFLNESKSEPRTGESLLNGRFACDTCGKRFASFVHLKRHKMEHDSERKFSCSLCPKTFRGISGLKQHISGFHYKIKPYTCSVCNYAYALKGDMQRCRHSKLKNQTSFNFFL